MTDSTGVSPWSFKASGIVHAVDIIVPLAILFIIYAAFFAPKKNETALIQTPSANSPIISNTWIEVYARAWNITPEVAAVIKEGDEEVINGGTVFSRLEKIFLLQDLYFDSNSNVTLKRMELKFLVKVHIDNGRYVYKNKYIKIGSNFGFSAKQYNLNCEIMKFGKIIEE